ncbi:uncharacterized protein C1orf131-like isoform X2 [Amphibalanus amphitrite]|uniref:uncharacterized protein C1orf131-like isoform X2 n=1 Tax=Amphibalanus amphitrite TaxID=1232801 RepID=UPI001C91404E|nr:uncharacterized protein C1orf131-like isoform X2 [Amphibalanus amphitrite]
MGKKKKPVVVDTMTTLAAAVRDSVPSPTVTSYSRERASSSTTAKKSPEADAAAPAAECDMQAARHEVFQLGLEGMSRARRRDARRQKLVRLGAKPPPREATNYRLLMEEAKRKRVAEKQERETLRKSGLALPNVDQLKDFKKFKKPRNKNRVRGFDGQPGRFQKGVQILPRRVRKS